MKFLRSIWFDFCQCWLSK